MLNSFEEQFKGSEELLHSKVKLYETSPSNQAEAHTVYDIYIMSHYIDSGNHLPSYGLLCVKRKDVPTFKS